MRSNIVKNELVVGAFVVIAGLLGLFYGLKKTRETLVGGMRRLLGRGLLDAGTIDAFDFELFAGSCGIGSNGNAHPALDRPIVQIAAQVL